MNIEQEIWNDFQSLAESSLMGRLSHATADAHFGVSYDDRGSLISAGLNKRLLYDEDYKINKFLSNSDLSDVDWNELVKLYPDWEPIILPSKKIILYPKAKFRSKGETREINHFILNDWQCEKIKFYQKIPTEHSASEYLIDLRWGDSPICPRCENRRIYLIENNKRFKCGKCSLKFTEKVGTIFQYSNLKLMKWYEAIYLLNCAKTKKISSIQLEAAIDVSQKTSYFMMQKIKSKINNEFINQLKQKLFK